ncbi:acyloxyacyl hydrolase [Bacteroidota bacterium]
MNCHKVFVALFLIFYSITSISAQVNSCQQTVSPWNYGTRLYYGSIFKYQHAQPLIGFSNLQGFDFFASKQTYGNDSWSEYYRYPEIEIGISAYRFDKHEVFGNMFSIGSILKYNLLEKNKSSFTLSLGPAVNYATKVYDREHNTANKAVSAHWNIEIRGNMNYRYNLNQKWKLIGSMTFRHVSNGGYKKPNQGQNFIMIGVGTVYTPQDIKVEYQESDPKYFKNRIRVHMMYNRGWKHMHSWMDYIDFINAITISASKRISNMNSIVLGLDGIYDSSTYNEYWWLYGKVNGQLDENYVNDNRRAGLFGGITFHFGNLSMYFNFGGYIYLPNLLSSYVYQKYGFTYHFFDHVFLHTCLLAHRGKADHLQFGLGFTI